MQYDYGLRQGRSRPLSDRPDTFVSAKGKVIAVDKKVAAVNEGVLENGRVRILFSRPFWIPYSRFGYNRPFTKNWSANSTQNRSSLFLKRLRSSGQHGMSSHSTTFLRPVTQPLFSALSTCWRALTLSCKNVAA